MVKIIGHRGAAGLEPENTLRSFRRAVDEGSDMIEFDIQLTSDGIPVVIHDPLVDRTTDGSGKVSDLSLAEIRKLDAGMGESIPTLDDVLESMWGRVGLNIELKGENTALPVSRSICRLLRERGSTELLISSFSPVNLKEFAEITGRVSTAVLVDRSPSGSDEFAEMIGSVAVHPNHQFLDQGFVNTCRERGLKVNPWTVDENDDIDRCLSMGVDGIITNRPDILAKRIKH